MSLFIREAKLRLGLPLAAAGAMWLLEIVNLVAQGALLSFGIRPRTPDGLWGIISAPFIHANLAHLLANTIPLLVLGWLVAARGLRDFIVVTAIVMVLGGGAVWLFGRPFSNHIGASGVVFGYLGFLLARGVLERRAVGIIVSIATFALYGGAIWGILPSSPRISWEGHLFGFLAGIVAAWLVTRPPRSTLRSSQTR